MAVTEIESKAETGYKKLKLENDTLTQENVKLTQKSKELWGKAANLDIQVLDVQRENEALKAKLEALNEAARNNLAKKNIEGENLAELKKENTLLIKEVAILGAANGSLKTANVEAQKINEDLTEVITVLRKRINEFNDFKTVQDKAASEKENILNSLKLDFAKLKKENEIYKNEIGLKKGKMYAFKTTVIFLAVLANYFLLGKKFMNLTGEDDWQTYLISYGSVLIFDLTVILLTLLNRSKEALYFAIGVFVLTFLQIAKPFSGLGLNVDFYGFNLQYFERFVSGGIYSVFFAFLPYFLSKITKDS